MANKEKETKNKKRFLKDFKAELKKVIWPTPKQLVNNTAAVVVIVIMTAAIVFALDFAFESLNKYGINPIKSKVRGENISVEQNIDEENHVHVHEEENQNVMNVENTEGNVVENNEVENSNAETNNVNE